MNEYIRRILIGGLVVGGVVGGGVIINIVEKQVVGTPTATDEFPEVVALGRGNDKVCCAGILIGPNDILTAAHCVENGCAERVRSGTSVFGVAGVSITECFVHKGWDGIDQYDAALVRTQVPVQNGSGGVRFASSASIDGAKKLLVVGYGSNKSKSSGMKGVQRKAVVHVTASRCGPADSKTGCNQGYEIVVDGKGKGGACVYDSGGPAILRIGSENFLAGILSREGDDADGCGETTIYVRAEELIDRKDWLPQSCY